MKAFGHTKTLFVQAGKYKWSYKHDYCTGCLGVSFKHKGNGLCTSCWDKKRHNNPDRIISRRNAGIKWHVVNKPKKPREEWAKMGPKPKGLFDKKTYQKQWYEENKIYLATLKKGKLWSEKGIACISYRGYPLPLQDLDKPKICDNARDTIEGNKTINAWKERMKLFDMMRIYIDKKLSKKAK